MRGLEVDELAEETVVFRVGDLGIVEHVVLPGSTLELGAQRRDLLDRVVAHDSPSGQSVASATEKIFTPCSSNLMTSSSPLLVIVLLSTVPSP